MGKKINREKMKVMTAQWSRLNLARKVSRREKLQAYMKENRRRTWEEYLALGEDVIKEASEDNICELLGVGRDRLRRAIEENGGKK